MIRWGLGFAVVPLALLLLAGCATVDKEDFLALQSHVVRNQHTIRSLQSKVDAISQSLTAGQGRAGLLSEVQAMQQEVARLRGRVDENAHRLTGLPSGDALAKQITASQGEMEQRLARVEAYLGIKKGSAAPAGRGGAAPAAKAPTGGDLYDLGYSLYQKKSYAAARDRFQAYLKKYPKGRRAPNAHFWIGETFSAQKRYEEAILSYNQVIKRWPKSSKAPAALYKQALAFAWLGDKRTARIVLNKLIKEYPGSGHVSAAKKQLQRLK